MMPESIIPKGAVLVVTLRRCAAVLLTMLRPWILNSITTYVVHVKSTLDTCATVISTDAAYDPTHGGRKVKIIISENYITRTVVLRTTGPAYAPRRGRGSLLARRRAAASSAGAASQGEGPRPSPCPPPTDAGREQRPAAASSALRPRAAPCGREQRPAAASSALRPRAAPHRRGMGCAPPPDPLPHSNQLQTTVIARPLWTGDSQSDTLPHRARTSSGTYPVLS
ncbi:hypothetical protein Pelo_5084 [Pelomyxa schiedti]|nr:hypothetical protein Pelo_5084 [Pelomyxa schiedti]